MLANINSYIESPEKLDEHSLTALDELINKYPFFQTARLLHIKNIQNVNLKIDEAELHLTATYVSDRKALYYLLHKNQSSHQNKYLKAGGSQQFPVGKDIKDSMKENISTTLNNQLNIYETSPSSEVELIPGLAIDIIKEYGEGIDLDDKIYSINNSNEQTEAGREFFELMTPSEEYSSENLSEVINNGQSSTSDIIEDNTPISQESHSFTSWLDTIDSKLISKAEIHQNDELITIDEEESEFAITNKDSVEKADLSQAEKNNQNPLIDKFIENSPGLGPVKETTDNEDISKDSVREHESFFTDTLAQIYVKQGHYAKAIFAYEKLSLKYPEKSTYFASQISEIKKLINNS